MRPKYPIMRMRKWTPGGIDGRPDRGAWKRVRASPRRLFRNWGHPEFLSFVSGLALPDVRCWIFIPTDSRLTEH